MPLTGIEYLADLAEKAAKRGYVILGESKIRVREPEKRNQKKPEAKKGSK